MNTIDKWAERVYAETDFGRSIATSFAGVVGLISYLVWRDWAIAAFSSIIVFPIIRLVSAGLHNRVVRQARNRAEKAGAESVYARLSYEEKDVVQAFVQAGGCVLTWSHVNQLPVSGPVIESLIQREVISTSTTADCTRETFVLDSAIFDVGQERSKSDQRP
jgi:hypothetical protein